MTRYLYYLLPKMGEPNSGQYYAYRLDDSTGTWSIYYINHLDPNQYWLTLYDITATSLPDDFYDSIALRDYMEGSRAGENFLPGITTNGKPVFWDTVLQNAVEGYSGGLAPSVSAYFGIVPADPTAPNADPHDCYFVGKGVSRWPGQFGGDPSIKYWDMKTAPDGLEVWAYQSTGPYSGFTGSGYSFTQANQNAWVIQDQYFRWVLGHAFVMGGQYYHWSNGAWDYDSGYIGSRVHHLAFLGHGGPDLETKTRFNTVDRIFYAQEASSYFVRYDYNGENPCWAAPPQKWGAYYWLPTYKTGMWLKGTVGFGTPPPSDDTNWLYLFDGTTATAAKNLNPRDGINYIVKPHLYVDQATGEVYTLTCGMEDPNTPACRWLWIDKLASYSGGTFSWTNLATIDLQAASNTHYDRGDGMVPMMPITKWQNKLIWVYPHTSITDVRYGIFDLGTGAYSDGGSARAGGSFMAFGETSLGRSRAFILGL